MPNITEAQTRRQLIDPALEKAGWYLRDHSRVKLEMPVAGYDTAPWDGVTDYCLCRENGEVLAVVEAKRTVNNPQLAEAQGVYYAREIAPHQSFTPFVFLTNGHEIYFLDVDRSPRRLVAGFFSPADLENLLFIRQQGAPPAQMPINNQIVDHPYQHEAIRRVSEALEQGRRKALLVMATGTGKTRTAMGLIDVLLRANQARKILFVADRDALVEQAINKGFKKHIPHEPCTRLHSWNLDTSNRLYAVTLQTLSNCFEQFTPGFFDLIIFDEVHRSIFNKFNEVLEYFDARMIGLTATPAQYVDRNTFNAFGCYDGKPTYLYSYDQAIADGYLVDYELYAAQTHFQRQGIHGIDLSEEDRNALIEQGIDPDEIDYSGSELESVVTVPDTERRQWEEIMQVCLKDASGLPGKTIVFAITQEHALRLETTFNEMYPHYAGLVSVITHKSEYRGTRIDEFTHRSKPRIAISVDMLDTGIDVPEVVNLVFMKPVQSPIKLHQMIGRGTRSDAACEQRDWLPDGHKTHFMVMDFWENNFSKDAVEVVDTSVPVLVTIFNTRLKLLEYYLDKPSDPQYQRTIADLRAMLARIPTASFSVKRIFPQIESAWQDSFWSYLLTPGKLDFLRMQVGPLLRLAPDVDVAAETFTSKVERLKLFLLTGKETTAIIQSIAEDVASLPQFVYEDPQLAPLTRLCAPTVLAQATPAQLDAVHTGLAGQMKYKRRQRSFLTLDLQDYIAISGYIMLTQTGEQMYVTEYRRQVEQRILDLVADNPAIQAIQRGQPVDDWQLLELERTLQQALGSQLELSAENIRKAYGLKVDSLLGFLRQVLELDALPDYTQIVQQRFDAFITTHRYNADQIRFLRAVQSVFLQKRRLQPADLYAPPLTNFGQDAVDKWFEEKDIAELLEFANLLQL
ncbi:MAG TPA: DEAD/DEAH box helicase family protein [Anaerolineaceae bacterium]|nr:DEAD/DEAH box helicase family protein [Anaerolineaceae bacterium]